MGVLYLVRHGQASLFAEDYDQLSPLGEEQALRLGSLWARSGLRLDRVCTGPRVRQRRSAEIACAASARGGLAQPAIEVIKELDELPAAEIVRRAIPALVAESAGLGAFVNQIADQRVTPETQHSFQKMFETIIERWVRGRVPAGEQPFERWEDFCTRVGHALADLRAPTSARGRRVCAFTSAGPLAVAARVALDLSDAATLDVMWTVRNASVAEFLYSGPRFTLSAFNNTHHLDEPRLVTYR